MHFHPFALISLGFMPFSATALRGATTTKDAQRILQGNQCTINAISYLQIPDAEPIPGKSLML